MQIVVEPVTRLEDDVREFFVRTCITLYNKYAVPHTPDDLDALFEWERNQPGHKFLVARQPGQKAVGVLIHKPNFLEDSKKVYISQLVVDDNFQRRGIGTQIMKFLAQQYPGCTCYGLTRRYYHDIVTLYNKHAERWLSVEEWPSEWLSQENYLGFKRQLDQV